MNCFKRNVTELQQLIQSVHGLQQLVWYILDITWLSTQYMFMFHSSWLVSWFLYLMDDLGVHWQLYWSHTIYFGWTVYTDLILLDCETSSCYIILIALNTSFLLECIAHLHTRWIAPIYDTWVYSPICEAVNSIMINHYRRVCSAVVNT